MGSTEREVKYLEKGKLLLTFKKAKGTEIIIEKNRTKRIKEMVLSDNFKIFILNIKFKNKSISKVIFSNK